MLLFFFLLLIIKGEILNFIILYEKTVDDNVEELYKSIMEGIIRKFNNFLYAYGIYIRLEKIMSYNEYLDDKQFKDLSKVGGKENLEDRMDELAKINKNVLLIASIPGAEKDIEKDIDKPCKSKYITTFSNTNNMGDDTLSNMIKSFRSWMSHIFKVKAPNPIGKDSLVSIERFSSLVGKSEFLPHLEHCNAETDTDLNNNISGTDIGNEPEMIKLFELLQNIIEKTKKHKLNSYNSKNDKNNLQIKPETQKQFLNDFERVVNNLREENQDSKTKNKNQKWEERVSETEENSRKRRNKRHGSLGRLIRPKLIDNRK